ncbi:hypothetical protein GCM10011581_25190 [Saccharopolyspora subtropica]|uniref:Uncharacterized protein n=1 Tax=Saccharopolyspora thermophila TaxID=89367 RepID=A0A917NBY8_9PSEU|nr:hypothetical protein [Saccharopolyspora subtropica]GGI87094.1 hypothetical protein GCM10011581_25190 [Saccharopolyspora subtropica]
MARKVLIAQAVLLTAGLLALFVRELPGLVREVRMWRMTMSFRRGIPGKHPQRG